jgi:hypothetical protein
VFESLRAHHTCLCVEPHKPQIVRGYDGFSARGFSQVSVAEACNFTAGRINITVNTARLIALVLKITLSERVRGLS